MSGEHEKKLPPPVLLSAIICDRIIFDSFTGMPTIVGVLQTISAPKYPARHGRLAFFCELTNGHGKTNITVKLVDLQQEDQTILEQTVPAQFVDVKQVVALGLGFEGIIFPHPGEYRFQFYAGTNLLGERRVICRQIKHKRGDESNDSPNE
ncbi:MAG: hypothetical protein JW837_16430 [Sedimentisphaerales bacterium]|nr:hypothetical protein [Sedimentisphaerales bacterium]